MSKVGFKGYTFKVRSKFWVCLVKRLIFRSNFVKKKKSGFWEFKIFSRWVEKNGQNCGILMLSVERVRELVSFPMQSAIEGCNQITLLPTVQWEIWRSIELHYGVSFPLGLTAAS